VLGTHAGIYRFTVGQRRGLGISHPKPLYVLELDVEDNTVVVGYKEDLYSAGLVAKNVNWLSRLAPTDQFEADVKVRANHSEVPALVRPIPEDSRIEIQFQEPQMAVTPGQAAVIYQGSQVLGGGWISSAIP
jgi:tRNA-specific 2-thiouridylase